MRDFRKYEVWKDSVTLANEVYSVCESFPKFETFALGDQMRRAAVSIASNIAEGSSRSSSVEFAHFLEISMGSAYETETQLEIAKLRGYISDTTFDMLSSRLWSIEKRLNALISKLRTENNKNGR